jgi:Flp pilus assembly pilin Flp
MRRLLRSERGAVTAEYGGLMLLVGAIVMALVFTGPGVGQLIASGVQRAVCSVFAGCEAGGAGGSGEVAAGDAGGTEGEDEEDGGGILGTLGDVAGGAWDGIQQVGGVFKGAGEGLWEMGTGLVDLGWNLGKASVKSGPLWFFVDRDGWEQQWQQNADVASYIWNNPGEVASGIWHGIVDPIAEDWNNGNYGEAVGRGVVEVLGAVFGGKGLNKLGRAGGAVDDAADLGRVDELGDAGRVAPGAGAVLPGADDVIVLGKYPAYLEEANRVGGRTFNIPDDVWARMSDAERWAANQKFLDRAIARGSEIRLASSPLDPRNMTGYFAMEIEYLLKRGYTISPDGTHMIPPGG